MPNILPIIIYPDNILRKKSINIKKVDKEIRQLVLDMGHTMIAKDGVGLSAPQIGKNIRLIIINTKDGIVAMINPKITKKFWAKEVGEEGCLSIPDFFGPVKRSKKINVIYTDLEDKTVKLKAEGLFARVIQHEVDHLEGILFIDYLPKKKQPPV
ncbi:MAG: peptide deformylase [bacterium]|nr:peptide deformylase [bacterium]